jgi:tryptophanyl-tRNA synthetase
MGKTIKEVEKEFAGQNYAQLKDTVAEAVIATLKPIQEKFSRIRSDKAYLTDLIKKGA